MIISEKKGFTLIEIMIVIVIIGILSTIAVPSYQHFMARQRLNGAARMVMSDLMSARMQAVSKNNEFRILFVNNSPTYRILDDTNNNGVINAGEVVVTRNIQADYRDVNIVCSSANPIFYPRGTSNGTTVELSNLTGSKYVIVAAFTGRVRIADTGQCP